MELIEHDWRTLEISHCDAARPRFTRIVNGSSRRIGYHVVPTYAYQADSPSKRLSQLHSFVSFFSSTESGANLTGPFIPVSNKIPGGARGFLFVLSEWSEPELSRWTPHDGVAESSALRLRAASK